MAKKCFTVDPERNNVRKLLQIVIYHSPSNNALEAVSFTKRLWTGLWPEIQLIWGIHFFLKLHKKFSLSQIPGKNEQELMRKNLHIFPVNRISWRNFYWRKKHFYPNYSIFKEFYLLQIYWTPTLEKKQI